MNERVFGPHDPGWTNEHQEASEPTERELLLIRQRDDARALAEEACKKYNALLEEKRKVTCVYCGQEYPEGTPASQDAALTAHIEVCSEHPLYEARAQIATLEAALRTWEKDSACLPEDQSITETVTYLRERLVALQQENDSFYRGSMAWQEERAKLVLELNAQRRGGDTLRALYEDLKKGVTQKMCAECIIDNGAMVASRNKALAELAEAKAEAEQFVETQWQAARRARERYAEAHPEDKVWPDRADLLVWLMEELEHAGKDEATWYAKGHNAGRAAAGMSLEIKMLRESLRKLWYLRVPTGMKLEEMLLELGHKELWREIHPLVEPEK